MTDREPFDTDDTLRALLRNSDPAHSLPPANAAALAHLLEDIMSTDLDVRPESDEATRASGTRGRNPLTWLVAAAAAVVIAGAGGFAISSFGGDDAPPSASPSTPDRSAPDPGTSADAGGALAPVPGTTDLGFSSAQTGKCATPSATFVAAQEQAFAGTVTAIDGDTVTLQTGDVYSGEVGESVVVTAPAAEMRLLISATEFKVGQSYLVSATGGLVSVCGLTGKAGPQLQTLYNEAFTK